MIKLLPRLGQLSSDGQGAERKCTYLGPSTTGVNFRSQEGNCLGVFTYYLNPGTLLFLNDLGRVSRKGCFYDMDAEWKNNLA